MQVINLNLPNESTSVPVQLAPITNTSSETLSVNFSEGDDICEKGGPCNELVYSVGTVVNIGQVPDCDSPMESFQRSLTQPIERRIPGGKSNTINLDLGPGDIRSIIPSSVGLDGVALVRIVATCGDVLVSFDCENWFGVKELTLDSSSSVDCQGSQAAISEIHIKNYYPPEGLTTCDGQKIKRARVEMILVGS